MLKKLILEKTVQVDYMLLSDTLNEKGELSIFKKKTRLEFEKKLFKNFQVFIVLGIKANQSKLKFRKRYKVCKFSQQFSRWMVILGR